MCSSDLLLQVRDQSENEREEKDVPAYPDARGTRLDVAERRLSAHRIPPELPLVTCGPCCVSLFAAHFRERLTRTLKCCSAACGVTATFCPSPQRQLASRPKPEGRFVTPELPIIGSVSSHSQLQKRPSA